MSEWTLAQLNVARMKAPMDAPLMADFVANLPRINAVADAAPGFLWRLQDEAGDATALRPFGDEGSGTNSAKMHILIDNLTATGINDEVIFIAVLRPLGPGL